MDKVDQQEIDDAAGQGGAGRTPSASRGTSGRWTAEQLANARRDVLAQPADERDGIVAGKPHEDGRETKVGGDPREPISLAAGTTVEFHDVGVELAGEDADKRLPGMREHLQGWPGCREDHESLRDPVAQD